MFGNLLCNVCDIYKITVSNVGGIEKPTEEFLCRKKCRLDLHKTSSRMYDMNRDERRVSQQVFDLYLEPGACIEKDYIVVIDGERYVVDMVHTNYSFARKHHIYCNLSRIY